ncbi:MAG: succinylglutamate desuccinylase/aspartoacylase family protein [Acidobacteriota bacterium]|nr:succinylglutamate desuccinylase/aspartoacylase family protein [Acidobacteriota bacterium]
MEVLQIDPQPEAALAVPAVEPEQARLLPRVLGQLGDPRRGSTLLCVAGLHGNEPSGLLGVQAVLEALASEDDALKGCLVGLSGNRQALAEGRRFIDRDLNRVWRKEEIERVRNSGGSFAVSEDGELADLEREVRRVLEAAQGRVFLLDLHSTSAPGPAFVVFEDTLPNREFALAFPVTLVLGIEEELEGTLSAYSAELGMTTVGFEAGQHDDPASVQGAAAAVWIALAAAGVVSSGRPEVRAARRRLKSERRDAPHVVEVRHRHAVAPAGGFRMLPDFVSFQPVEEGELLAKNSSGPIHAPGSGRILMPLYQEQGEDGFFIVRSVRPLWLGLSAAVRRLRLERIVHWLPGVRRDPGAAGTTFDVDTHVARWYTLQLFHLLGFRRTAYDERWLRMRRRRHDR